MNTSQYDHRKPSTIETLQADIQSLLDNNKSEKLLVIAGLQRYLADPPDTNAEFVLSNLIVSSTHESSLQMAHRAGQSRLNALLQSTEFLSLNELSHLPDTAEYVCDSKKNMHVWVEDTPMQIDDLLTENEILNQHLDELSGYADEAGGYISSAGDINVEQWLRFYGHPLPSTVQHLQNFLDLIKLDHLALSVTENRFELLKDPGLYPTELSPAQRQQIQALTHSFGSRNTGHLLDRLVEEVIGTAIDSLRFSPLQHINTLLNSVNGNIWAKGYLEALGWYGTRSGETPSPDDLQLLLMTAILLNLDPETSVLESKSDVLGYELYKPERLELTPARILLELEQHLIAKQVISVNSAPLAAYILIANVAPEFLVQKIPEELTIGSPLWVVHSLAVAKIESIAPGSSGNMTYEQVQSYAGIGAFDEHTEQLFGLTVITPILNWAALNGLIPYSATGEYSGEQFTSAQAYYIEYTEALEQCSNAMNSQLPIREETALNELKRVIPDEQYLTRKVFVHYHHRDPISIHEIFMSGDLIEEGLTGNTLSTAVTTNHDLSMLDLIKRHLHELQNIENLYKSEFDDYFKNLRAGTGTLLKLAISKMPARDRIRIEYGQLSFYTVRKKFSDAATHETQRLRDKHRGRYGIILCAKYKSELYYYELFTLQAECYSRPDLRSVFGATAIEYFEPTESAEKDEKQWQTQALDWPLDINAYLNGTKPVKNVTHKVVVEKLWESYEAERLAPATRSALEIFFSQTIQTLVDNLIKYSPPATYDELYNAGYGVAPIEAAKKNSQENVDLILNLVIPFRSCIADLTSGDPSRRNSGIVGCTLDALAVVGSVAGVATKFASIALKSGSLLTKSLKLARVTASFALSLVNPLDGVPDLLKKGGSLTKKCALLITGRGLKTSGKATRQLRNAGGTLDAFNAAKSLSCTDVKIADLVVAGELSDATQVLIMKRGVDWYQLSLNNHKARGAKITHFQPIV
ncbi:hypothetical protein PS918_00899 [Pseudomonas fluorescens]|uniref:Uncharacterized protein n=1 Tax=Pseudomonas fluorescens TaxID=294 RepID=A0A5E7R6J5_PSEFL|nr:hypothetical protein [Pseudomonas fluorescens]VVP69198.1 hypothetical protein PS918_00899 [Pseudomonas fluorescens]